MLKYYKCFNVTPILDKTDDLIQRYANADLKISLYIQIYIKIAPKKFRIFNRKNSWVIHP